MMSLILNNWVLICILFITSLTVFLTRFAHIYIRKDVAKTKDFPHYLHIKVLILTALGPQILDVFTMFPGKHKQKTRKYVNQVVIVVTLAIVTAVIYIAISRINESMMGLRPRQGNLRQVFRLFKSHPRLCRELGVNCQ